MQFPRNEHFRSQEARILELLKANPTQWIPAWKIAAPDEGPRILQYSRAISNLRKGKFDGARHNIQNKTERQAGGEVHGFFRLEPGEWTGKSNPSVQQSPTQPKSAAPIESAYMCARRLERETAAPLFAGLSQIGG
jgi:hypothetical protein